MNIASESSYVQQSRPSLDEERRAAFVKAGMQIQIEYFIKGGRNLKYEFIMLLYYQGILTYQEYGDYGKYEAFKLTAEAKNLTEKQLEAIKLYENSIYARVTNALLRIFPEFKPRNSC